MAKRVIGLIGLLLGVLSITSGGFMGCGGYIFGLPAIIIGSVLYKKHRGVVPLLSIILGTVGVAGAIAAMFIVYPI